MVYVPACMTPGQLCAHEIVLHTTWRWTACCMFAPARRLLLRPKAVRRYGRTKAGHGRADAPSTPVVPALHHNAEVSSARDQFAPQALELVCAASCLLFNRRVHDGIRLRGKQCQPRATWCTGLAQPCISGKRTAAGAADKIIAE
jgi:hypothetical protein